MTKTYLNVRIRPEIKHKLQQEAMDCDLTLSKYASMKLSDSKLLGGVAATRAPIDWCEVYDINSLANALDFNEDDKGNLEAFFQRNN